MTKKDFIKKVLPVIALAVIIYFSGVHTGYQTIKEKISLTHLFENNNPVFIAKKQKLKSLKIYYPENDRLVIYEKKLESERPANKQNIVSEVVSEFLTPYQAKLIAFYVSDNGIIYLDMSQELKQNFKGSLTDEYLLIHGLIHSLKANLSEVKGVQILLDGREVESLGGHIKLSEPILGWKLTDNK
jgi:hypothetical protein